MSTLEIIGGVFLILTCIFIIAVIMLQEGKSGMGAALTGQESQSGRGRGRTRDAMLNRVTKIAAGVFFVLTLAVYVITLYA